MKKLQVKKIIFTIALFLIAIPAYGATTLFNYYAEKGENLPSVSERTPIAEQCNISNYKGSYGQNIALLGCLEETPKFDIPAIFERFGMPPVTEKILGGNVPVSATSWALAIPHSSTDTTIDLVDFEDLRGNDVATTSMPTKIYFVVEPENPRNTELVLCLSANGDETNTKFTSCTRGLAFSGTAETSVTANQKSHPAGAYVIMSNPGQFFNNFVDIDSAQTVAGVKTFSSYPKIETYVAPTDDEQFAPKKYIDDTAIAGAPDMTTTVKGIGEQATRTEIASSTTTGGTTAPLVMTAGNATSTPWSDSIGAGYTCVTEDDGNISEDCLPMGEDLTFSGNNIFSATTTMDMILNNTNLVALIASTSITGETTPQPVYIATSTSPEAGGVLLVDANASSSLAFIGFAVTTASSGETVYVQTDGIIDGFTGLTKGAKYYVQDTAGTIGTTRGTFEVLVGTAVSATEVLMQKGYWQYNGVLNALQSGTQFFATTTPEVNFILAKASGTGTNGMLNCSFTLARLGMTSAICESTSASSQGRLTISWDTTTNIITGDDANGTTISSLTVYQYR